MSHYWFVPRPYGYGCIPVTWQGWLTVAVYTFGSMGFALAVIAVVESETLGASMIIGWVVASLIPFIRFCQARTNGVWRWRWGPGQ